jgi:hypothetical protein
MIVILIGFSQQFWRFWSFGGDIGPLFEAISWGEVGRLLPTSDIYKQGLLNPWRIFRAGLC